jgi:NAD(P)-dependent dehydrogenase (short-subunit alcohol dehydrogenase family)
LATAGHDIFFTYRTQESAAHALIARLGEVGAAARCASVDLRDRGAVAQTLDAAGKMGVLRALVYAAGPPIRQEWFSQVTPEQWSEGVAGEIQGFFNLIHQALPMLRQASGAAIVATTSAGVHRVIPGDVLSAVPKAAIEALVRQVAREEGRYGIRANCVAPGIIDAGLGTKAQQDHYSPQMWEGQRRAIPLRQFGAAEAIGRAIAFLAADGCQYLTGQTLVVDGGLSV